MSGTTVHTLENQQLLEQVERESAAAARQLAETAHLRKGQLVVIGCSTSEVVGHQVGSWSTPEVADAIRARARRIGAQTAMLEFTRGDADDLFDDLIIRNLVHMPGTDIGTVSHDGNIITNLTNLRHLMGNIDEGYTS